MTPDGIQRVYEERTPHFRKFRLGYSTPRHTRWRANPPNVEAVIYFDDTNSMLTSEQFANLWKTLRSDKAKWKKLIELKMAGKIRGVDWDRLEQSCETVAPPKLATLLVLLIPKKNREHILGDLDEEYRTVLVPRYGLRTAKLWYWWQVGISVLQLVWSQVKWGTAIAWLWERIR